MADSFLKACKEEQQDDQVTFSIIDLSKTDEILTSFNSFAKDLYDAAGDTAKRADIVRSIWSVDNFGGWWISLPDGQNLATYIVGDTEDGIIYTSPVMLNGIETNLRLKLTEDKIVIEGAWDGIDDESGAASKDITKLKAGDRIIPMYYLIPLDADADADYDLGYYGDEYVFDGEPEIWYDMMYPGEYMYAFCIDDIYGDYYMTDFETFYIDDEGNCLWDYE